MRGVRRAGGDEARHASRLGDSFLEDLAVLGLAVVEELVGINGLVELTGVGVDAALLEQRIHTEGS